MCGVWLILNLYLDIQYGHFSIGGLMIDPSINGLDKIEINAIYRSRDLRHKFPLLFLYLCLRKAPLVYLACLFIFLFYLYPLNIKTAEPIRPT